MSGLSTLFYDSSCQPFGRWGGVRGHLGDLLYERCAIWFVGFDVIRRPPPDICATPVVSAPSQPTVMPSDGLPVVNSGAPTPSESSISGISHASVSHHRLRCQSHVIRWNGRGGATMSNQQRNGKRVKSTWLMDAGCLLQEGRPYSAITIWLEICCAPGVGEVPHDVRRMRNAGQRDVWVPVYCWGADRRDIANAKCALGSD